MTRGWRWLGGITVALLIAGMTVGWLIADDIVARRLRPAMIRLLEHRFNSDVELRALHIRVFPVLGIRGEGLVLRHKAHRDVPPLISIRSLTIESSVGELWSGHIDRVRVDGLHIVIPSLRSGLQAKAGGQAVTDEPDATIHELVADNGLLTMTSTREGKPAREFLLAHLRFEDLQFGQPTPFEAKLTNPVPEGVIQAVGTFGPWNREEPSLSPITGTFLFNADLGTIDGIDGDLHAEGSFNGPLERINTRGKTATRAFRLSSGGAEFPLAVEYKAVVDGTSGDTILESVEADLGASHISARGAIVKVPGAKGRRVALDARAPRGRIEDFIRLTTRVERAPMVGLSHVTARIDIPPGEGEVLDRLNLAGSFSLGSVRFTSEPIQDRIDELSRRGLGRPQDGAVDDVASHMRGAFRMNGGRLIVRSLTFQVEGADVRLAGVYNLHSEQLDFRGDLRMRAAMSETQTGWKSIVLKVFDPLFRKDGAGSVLPITITGTRESPQFRADIKKALLK